MLSSLTPIIRTIAREEILSRFLCVGTHRKKDGSLLSEADIATQHVLMREMRKIIHAPVLGEEMTFDEQKRLWNTHANSGLWVVDPIDGTTNFVNGIPHFALSVAFIQNGQPQLALTYNPITDELYSAQKDKGAFLNARPLPIKQHNKQLCEAVLAVDPKFIPSKHLALNIYTNCPCPSKRIMGSNTLDWCFLAAGRLDIYLHGGQRLWDYAAGSLIFTEAGGEMTTLEGDPFWSGEHVWQRSVIAGLQPGLFQEWKNWVEQNS